MIVPFLHFTKINKTQVKKYMQTKKHNTIEIKFNTKLNAYTRTSASWAAVFKHK